MTSRGPLEREELARLGITSDDAQELFSRPRSVQSDAAGRARMLRRGLIDEKGRATAAGNQAIDVLMALGRLDNAIEQENPKIIAEAKAQLKVARSGRVRHWDVPGTERDAARRQK
jgi:hypothetical protein